MPDEAQEMTEIRKGLQIKEVQNEKEEREENKGAHVHLNYLFYVRNGKANMIVGCRSFGWHWFLS